MDWAKTLQDEMRNIKVVGIVVSYIRGLMGVNTMAADHQQL